MKRKLGQVSLFACLFVLLATPSVHAVTIEEVKAGFRRILSGGKGSFDPEATVTVCNLLVSGRLGPLNWGTVTESDLQALVDFGEAKKLEDLLGLALAIHDSPTEDFMPMANLLNGAESSNTSAINRVLRVQLFEACPWRGEVGLKRKSLDNYLPGQLQGVQYTLPADFDAQVRNFLFRFDRAKIRKYFSDTGHPLPEGHKITGIETNLIAASFIAEVREGITNPERPKRIDAMIDFIVRTHRDRLDSSTKWVADEILAPVLREAFTKVKAAPYVWKPEEVKAVMQINFATELNGMRERLRTKIAGGWRPHVPEDVKGRSALLLRQEEYIGSVERKKEAPKAARAPIGLVASLPAPEAIRAILDDGFTLDAGDLDIFMKFWGGLKLEERQALWMYLFGLRQKHWTVDALVERGVVHEVPGFGELYVLHAFTQRGSTDIGRIVFTMTDVGPVLIAWYRSAPSQIRTIRNDQILPAKGDKVWAFITAQVEKLRSLQ